MSSLETFIFLFVTVLSQLKLVASRPVVQVLEGVGTCNAFDFGVVGDNVTDDTNAIQNALDGCHEKYPISATVVLPGKNSGSVFRVFSSIALVSNTTLLLEDNVTIYCSQSPKEVPKPLTSRCDTSYWNTTAIFCGRDISNAAIIGTNRNNSILDGGGMGGWYTDGTIGTGPRLYEVAWSKNLTVKHLTLKNSPNWTFHPQYCKNIIAQDIQILNPRDAANTDGFDPDSCVNVILRDSFIDTGDDGVAIKSSNSSRDPLIQMPSQNIHIYNTTVLSRNIAIGSQTYGGIYDVVVENCTIGDDKGSSPWAIKYKSHRYYPGEMSNHTYRNIKIGYIAPNDYQQPDGGQAFVLTSTYMNDNPVFPEPSCPSMCPIFKDIVFENITVLGASEAGLIQGTSNNLVQGMTFTNINFIYPPQKGWTCEFVAEGAIEQNNVNPYIECPGQSW